MLGRRPRLLIAGASGVAFAIGILLVVVAFGGGGEGDGGRSAGPDEVQSAGLATEVPTAVATIDASRATAPGDQNLNLNSLSDGDRMVIAKIGVDAPLSYKAVIPSPDGVTIPPRPNGPDDVAYYDFSAYPGLGGAPGVGGNAVFAGEVDSGKKPCKNGTVQPPCEAVFWDLKMLLPGDEIQVYLSGSRYSYRVTANEAVSASQTAWEKVYAATAQPSLTLITCAGSFADGQYDKRIVVTAELVG